MLRQENFYKKLNIKNTKTHGGEKGVGKRKTLRPLDRAKPLHLVLRSSKAVGQYNFLSVNNRNRIESIVYKQAAKFGVRISKYANVGNHLHLMLKFSNRIGFQNFLKSVCAMIARFVTKARRGNAFGKFWDALAFTRIITSSKEVAVLIKYIAANQIEATRGRFERELYLKNRAGWELQLYSTIARS